MFKFIIAFIAGYQFYALCTDFIGQEKFIDICKNNWVNSSITMPIHTTIIILCIIAYGVLNNGC